MKGNRRTDTKPEVRLRSALHRRGYRFRKDYRIEAGDIRVRGDIVFTRHKVVAMVDGCFWHKCPEHGNVPRANTDYWVPKLQRNVERDRRVDRGLRDAGWEVVRVWEHEPVEKAAERVEEILSNQ